MYSVFSLKSNPYVKGFEKDLGRRSYEEHGYSCIK